MSDRIKSWQHYKPWAWAGLGVGCVFVISHFLQGSKWLEASSDLATVLGLGFALVQLEGLGRQLKGLFGRMSSSDLDTLRGLLEPGFAHQILEGDERGIRTYLGQVITLTQKIVQNPSISDSEPWSEHISKLRFSLLNLDKTNVTTASIKMCLLALKSQADSEYNKKQYTS